jgi:hypothetical protein
LVFVVTACSSPSPEVQNGIAMAPELKNLEDTLKAKMDTILEQSATSTEIGVTANRFVSQTEPITPSPSNNDSIAIIDTVTNYAYSNEIGFYKEDPYLEGANNVYRNSKGQILDRITTIQMRQMQTMSLEERQDFVNRHMQALSEAGVVSPSIESLAQKAVHAPYRQIDTASTGLYQLQGNITLGDASRMGASGVGVESANNFVGITSSKTVMDIGYYSNSYFYGPNDTNPGWGGFVNIYDPGKFLGGGAYYDFGAEKPTCCGRIVTKAVPNRVTIVWVRNELNNGGLVAAIFKYYDQLASGNPQKTIWRYFSGLSAKSADVKLYRSSSLLSKDGAKLYHNGWGPSFFWRTKADTVPGQPGNYVQISSSNSIPNTNVKGNEYPYETCPSAGGTYNVGAVYISCRDTNFYFVGWQDFEVKY